MLNASISNILRWKFLIQFWDIPRLVTHIDDYAINSLRKHYQNTFPSDGDFDILDMCSSWISHYPNMKIRRAGRALTSDDQKFSWNFWAGLGMNKQELKENPQLTEFVVHDLNENPVPLFQLFLLICMTTFIINYIKSGAFLLEKSTFSKISTHVCALDVIELNKFFSKNRTF